jgi:uncharacterized protein (TIGR03066 family)
MTRRTKIVLGIAAVAMLAAGVFWAGFGRSGTNKKRLLGTWTSVSGNAWGKTALTFAEDGKVKTTTQWDRKTYDSEGTYTVRGDTIEMFIPGGDWGDWGGNYGGWGDWNTAGGGESDKATEDTKPKQPSEAKPRIMTIRSLSKTELVVADERGHKTIYARK